MPTESGTLDLTPASWIWLDCARTLQNTLVLFRFEFDIPFTLISAQGWIFADSRYRFHVNGQRVQQGPASCDPRVQEVDPLDIAEYLYPGKNVIGIEVLFYGTGDGTWPGGAPGLIARIDIKGESGGELQVCTSSEWQCFVDRAWTPGQAKRWYLRAFQEICDTRRHPIGWNQTGFVATTWTRAKELPGRPYEPSILAGARDYQYDAGIDHQNNFTVTPKLVQRPVPMLNDREFQYGQLRETAMLEWNRDPEDWFQFRLASSFVVTNCETIQSLEDISTVVKCNQPLESHVLTFELPYQVVGYPILEFESEPGTVIEILLQESHELGGESPFLDTHHFSWFRVISDGSRQVFEAFEYESCKWMQVHIRGAVGSSTTIHMIGLRLRQFPWKKVPGLCFDDSVLQSVFDASLRTLNNSAGDHFSDGLGRERQQYAGDCSHQLPAVRSMFGEFSLPERFLRTFSLGQTSSGYFLDCWPAYDRLNRIAQRELGLTKWGPILDHGIQLAFDFYLHWMETGNIDIVADHWSNLMRQVEYFESLVGPSGLLPVENLGVPIVWIDHDGFECQRDRQCSFNVYLLSMVRRAMVPMAQALADHQAKVRLKGLADSLHSAIASQFMDDRSGLLVDNLPWCDARSNRRTHDRTLSMATIWKLGFQLDYDSVRTLLREMPKTCGKSYPANAGYRLKALALLGEEDSVWQDLRTTWAQLPSVLENGTLQEHWNARRDSTDEWSHCSVAPLTVLVQGLLGLEPLSPGYSTWQMRPRLGGVSPFSLRCYTVGGPFEITYGDEMLHIVVPNGVGSGNLVLQGNGSRSVVAGEHVVVQMKP